MADRFARKKEGELAAGTYQGETRKQWADFRREYQERMADAMDAGTRRETLGALNHFERIARPKRI